MVIDGMPRIFHMRNLFKKIMKLIKINKTKLNLSAIKFHSSGKVISDPGQVSSVPALKTAVVKKPSQREHYNKTAKSNIVI